jgi:hypothetical protein
LWGCICCNAWGLVRRESIPADFSLSIALQTFHGRFVGEASRPRPVPAAKLLAKGDLSAEFIVAPARLRSSATLRNVFCRLLPFREEVFGLAITTPTGMTSAAKLGRGCRE